MEIDNGNQSTSEEVAPVYGPRQYQMDIASEGLKRNIIVKLDTGSGKTFIAVMLIRHYMTKSRLALDEGGQRCVFLVKNVPLVRQQAAEIRRCLFTAEPEEVGEFIGHMSGEWIDIWSGDKWLQVFEKHRILVMTADIFKDLLYHSKVRPCWVSLLVLDECHHADKGDAYATICQRLSEMKGWDRSGLRLVGLTACLFNGNIKKGKLRERLDELQARLLDSRIVTSTNSEAEAFRLRCTEETVFYSLMFSAEDEKSESITDPIYLLLSSSVAVAKQRLNSQRDSGGDGSGGSSRRARNRESGPLVSDTPLRKCQRALADSLSALKDLGYFCCFQVMQLYEKELHDVSQGSSGPLKPMDREAIDKTLDILRQASEQYKLMALSKQTPEDLCSEKCNLLLKSLLNHYSELSDGECFRAVVFTQERVIARAVKEFLCEVTGYRSELSFLRSDFVTGHGTSSEQSSDVSMSLKQQDRALRLFRSGEVNTLIATRVIEEGMDVRQCSLVIKFDFPPEFRSYVQSKGRARAAVSRYVIMIDREKENDCRNKLCYYQWLDEALRRELIKMRAAYDAQMESEAEASAEFTAESAESAGPLDLSVARDHPAYYEVASTGAKAVLKTAVSLINRYTTKLASMGCTRPPPPHFDTAVDPVSNLFQCRLYLPRPCPLVHPVSCRGVRLSADDARRSAALEAVRSLHRIGELDDHLLPKEREARCLVEELRCYEPGQGTRGRHTWLPKPAAKLFSADQLAGSATFYSHKLDVPLPGVKLPPCGWRLALLTRGAALPRGLAFPLFLGSESSQFRPEPGQSLTLTDGQLARLVAAQAPLTRLMLRCHNPAQLKDLKFEWPLASGCPNGDNPDGAVESICQLVAVVRDDIDNPLTGGIDWDLLEHLMSPNSMTGPATVERPAIGSDGPLQPGVLVQRLQEKGSKSWHYVTSVRPDGLVEFCRTPHLDALVYNPNASKGRMARLINRQTRPSTDRPNRLLAMPGVQVQLWCQLRALPAILYRINQVMLGCELMSLLKSALQSTGCVVDETPRLNCTAAAANPAGDPPLTLEQRAAIKFDIMDSIVANGFRSPDCGPGLTLTGCLRAVTLTHANDFHSMELLETLGDARLKLSVTARLFHKSDHTVGEGDLTRLRMREVRNAFLHCVAKERRLHRFVFSQDANRPEHFHPPCARPSDASASDRVADLRRWGRHVADKSIADVAEALTGLTLSACGGDTADAFLRWLDVPSASLPTEAEPAVTTLLSPEEFGVDSAEFCHFWSMAELDQLEEKLGYKFQRREFLLSAVTHATFAWNHVTDCYQRLEFLGDAVIDYLVTHYAACDCMDTGSPGAITDLRMSLTNNDLFAAVAVDHGLESHMLHFDDQLMSLVADYREGAARFSGPDRYRQMSDRFVAEAGADAARLVRLSAVKALGDLVESLVGAVFADSGWSLAAAWTLVRRLMSDPMRDFLAAPPINPVRQLHEIAASHRLAVKFEPLVHSSPAGAARDTPVPAATRMRLRVGADDDRFVYEESERNKRLCKAALARRFLADFAVSGSGGDISGGSGGSLGGKRKSPPTPSDSDQEGEAEAAAAGVSCTAAPLNFLI